MMAVTSPQTANKSKSNNNNQGLGAHPESALVTATEYATVYVNGSK
jgi:hypothetical protein